MANKFKSFLSILKKLRKVDDVVDGAWSYKTAAKSATKEVKNAIKYAKKPGIVSRYGQALRTKPIRTTLKTIAVPLTAAGIYSTIKNMGGTGEPSYDFLSDTLPTGPDGTTYNPYASTDKSEQILNNAVAQMAAINAAPNTGTGGTGSGSSGTGYTPAAYPGVGDQSGNITYVDNYGNLRSAFNKYAGNLQGYGSAKGAGIRSTYDQLSNESLADAAKAEAIALASSGDVQKIGRDYSAAALADVSGVGAAGPNELTGMTPVGGDSYDISAGVATDANIAADYVLRDLNLTRDDLQYMSGMAKQMGPAYEAQLNENITMLIANKQFELEQSIFGQQAEDRRSAAEMNQQRLLANESYRQQWLGNQEQYRQQAISDMAANDRQVARDQEQYRQETAAARIKRESDAAAFVVDRRLEIALARAGIRQPDPSLIKQYAKEWAEILEDPDMVKIYKSRGYDTDNPSKGWNQYYVGKLESYPAAG
jgi:hypothetical protein